MTLCWRVLQVPFLYKTKHSTFQQRMFEAGIHTDSGRAPPSQLGSSVQRHKQPQLASKAWISPTCQFPSDWKTISAPKPHTTAESYRQHLPNHQPSLVRTDLISNEIREQARRALAAFSFNEQKSLCTNTAHKTFCFRGQVHCPYIVSIWQRKEYALSSFCWMQPRSKITSEAVNNNFESISRIV